ncbi:MAG: DUF6588 family protein [Bacteriovoracaceae bacterium]
MKKQIVAVGFLLSSLSAFGDARFEDLSKKDVENVTKEFATNFTHTTASAPSTNGLWGIEFGVVAATMGSPKLKDIVNASGGDGKEFDTLYAGGGFLRVHVPFELFFESSILPSTKISDVEVDNFTFGVGWNAGSFFNLPFDLAFGYDVANGETSFSQEVEDAITSVTGTSKIKLESRTQKAWVGVSKKLLVFTPYAKFGVINMDSELSATANVNFDIFNYSTSQKESVKESGTYWAAGLQMDLSVLSIGVEAMSALGNNRYAAKFAFSF